MGVAPRDGGAVVDEEAFARRVAERAAGVPGVLAVGLGGSRAQGLHRPGFPAALRRRAARWWAEAARLTLDYTETVYAARGDAFGCAGGLARGWSRPRTPCWPPAASGR